MEREAGFTYRPLVYVPLIEPFHRSTRPNAG